MTEVNISSYPGTLVPGLFFILVQLYSNQGVSCRKGKGKGKGMNARPLRYFALNMFSQRIAMVKTQNEREPIISQTWKNEGK